MGTASIEVRSTWKGHECTGDWGANEKTEHGGKLGEREREDIVVIVYSDTAINQARNPEKPPGARKAGKRGHRIIHLTCGDWGSPMKFW